MRPARARARRLTAPDTLESWTGWLRVPKHAFELLGWSLRVAGVVVVPGITAWLLSSPPFRLLFAAAGVVIEKAALRRARRARFLGLGLTYLALLALPGVNLFVLPVAHVAATLLYLELDRK